MNEQFHKFHPTEFVDTHTVKMDSFYRKCNARCVDSLEELCANHFKSTQIKITGLSLNADWFKLYRRPADSQGSFPVVGRFKSGPARVYCDITLQRSLCYGMEFRQNASAAIFGVAE